MRNLFITHEYLDAYFYHIIIKPIESIDLNLTVQYVFEQFIIASEGNYYLHVGIFGHYNLLVHYNLFSVI